jgi:prepilin-type N-terminal cleavage/methylation domain-containing protein
MKRTTIRIASPDRNGPDRSGLTLMEVLVSIFIMAIGMLALLTLFPLGALRMDQAIKDERCAQAGLEAIELANILDLPNDPNVRFYLQDPNAATPDGISATVGPSKAVLVDPVGITPYLDSGQNVARISPACANDSNHPENRYEFFALMDDIVFQLGAGYPRQFGSSTTSSIGREVRWSWTYLLQRPQVQNPGITNCTVCVYSRRPVAGALEFTLPNASINITDGNISFTTTDPAAVKQIVPGQWVLDATLAISAGGAQPNLPAGTRAPMGNFYRITNVRQGASASETVLDLQTPIRGYSKLGVVGGRYTGTGANIANLVIQDGLVEVIDVGPLR